MVKEDKSSAIFHNTDLKNAEYASSSGEELNYMLLKTTGEKRNVLNRKKMKVNFLRA